MDYSHLFTGFFKANIIKINPDSEELKLLTGDTEKIEYSYIRKDGVKCLTLDIFIEDTKNNIFKYTIYLSSKVKESKTGSTLWINAVGDTQWVHTEEQLWDSFKEFQSIIDWKYKDGKVSAKYINGAVPNTKKVIGNKQYRKCLTGEDNLIHLLKIIKEFSPYDIDTNLLLNIDELISGNLQNLKIALKTGKDFDIVAFAYVDHKYEQKIHSEFLPVGIIKDINNDMNISQYNMKIYNKWIDGLNYNDDKYYKLGKLQVFNSSFLKEKKEIENDTSDY